MFSISLILHPHLPVTTELTHSGSVTLFGDISRSALEQVMACCLMAPSHYLTQYWLLVGEVLWHSPGNNSSAPNLVYCITCEKIIFLKLPLHLPGTNELKVPSLIASSAYFSVLNYTNIRYCNLHNRCSTVLLESRVADCIGIKLKVLNCIVQHTILW